MNPEAYDPGPLPPDLPGLTVHPAPAPKELLDIAARVFFAHAPNDHNTSALERATQAVLTAHREHLAAEIEQAFGPFDSDDVEDCAVVAVLRLLRRQCDLCGAPLVSEPCGEWHLEARRAEVSR